MLDPGAFHEYIQGLHNIGVFHFPCLSIFLEALLLFFLSQ